MQPLRRARRSPWTWWAGALVLIATVVVVVRTIDVALLASAGRAAVSAPHVTVAVLAVYGAAFLVRAAVWRRVLPDLSFAHALSALHVSLGANHLLPARLGEVFRVTSVVRRARVPVAAATATTVTLRAADLLAVGALALVLGPSVVLGVAGRWVWLVAALAVAGVGGGAWWSRRLSGEDGFVRLPGPLVALGTLTSWVLEGVVIWQAARWAGAPIDVADAVVVTAVTIAAQVAAIAPGGVGTYEAAATATLVAIGVPAEAALVAAVTAHAFKTVYALGTGAVAVAFPRPSMLGRLRLRRPAPAVREVATAPMADDPVVLFLPAHDEEATVGAVVARAPRSVHGHPVVVLVVDDGSDDDTAVAAAAAGATVVSHGRNRGLGAAVRTGFEAALDLGPAAVAFCDADGEYAPEELGGLVAPILSGDADYVVGSRFGGDIHRMLPHRRLGNRVLTAVLRVVSRTPITDGQSGYRALSPRAADEAEIVHDFNYAQVLTLDLVAKGFRYREVAISYRFREQGRSFVRLGRYLRAVVPAVYRELNAA